MDKRVLVRGGDGRSDRVDKRALVRGGDVRPDNRSLVRGGDGRPDRVDTNVSEEQDKEHCQLRSFWWQYAGDCALLASVCASHEAACHKFWSHEEWMHNLLLHTSDEHFLKVAGEYKKFCVNGAKKGVCGVCGITGLQNLGTKIPLDRLRFLILRGDQYDDSKYGEFKRELRTATTPKDIAIAKLRLETLHTYTHPNNGTVYHLYEGGVINDKSCLVCSTCKTAVSSVCSKKIYYTYMYLLCIIQCIHFVFVPKHTHQCQKLATQVNEHVTATGVARVSSKIKRMKKLQDGSVVFKAPTNSFAEWDFGRMLNYYIDDDGNKQEVKTLSPVERLALCLMVIGGEIHEVSHANDTVFSRRLRGHTIVMPCNAAQVVHTLVKSVPRKDIADWVKVIFQGTPNSYATKIAAQLNQSRVRMEYKTVSGKIKQLQQTGVYEGLELLSETECQWKENVDAVQREVTVFNDRRAKVHEAKMRSDVSEQWDPSCKTKQDQVSVY